MFEVMSDRCCFILGLLFVGVRARGEKVNEGERDNSEDKDTGKRAQSGERDRGVKAVVRNCVVKGGHRFFQVVIFVCIGQSWACVMPIIRHVIGSVAELVWSWDILAGASPKLRLQHR